MTKKVLYTAICYYHATAFRIFSHAAIVCTVSTTRSCCASVALARAVLCTAPACVVCGAAVVSYMARHLLVWCMARRTQVLPVSSGCHPSGVPTHVVLWKSRCCEKIREKENTSLTRPCHVEAKRRQVEVARCGARWCVARRTHVSPEQRSGVLPVLRATQRCAVKGQVR